MAEDRDVSAELWLIQGQKEPLIQALRNLATRPNTRQKDADRARIKRRLDQLVDREKALIQQL